MPEAPTLDVAIVAYRCRAFLETCLAALRTHAPAAPMEVYVVDNDSRDGTVELVRERFPEVHLLASPTNLGFATATNRMIRNGSAPFVLALNPDTRVTAGALDELLRLMESRPEIGICGCRLELEDGTFDHAARRSFPTPLSALGHFTGLGLRAPPTSRLAAYRAPTVERGPVDAVNGAFMLMRRRMLDDVGLFDEGYWMYMEDLDLCYRAAEAGYVTWYEPGVTVGHVKGASSGRNRRLRLDYAFHYGMYRFYRKHYARRRSGLLNALVYAGIAAKLATSVMRSSANRYVLGR